jgi:hypothetical protein
MAVANRKVDLTPNLKKLLILVKKEKIKKMKLTIIFKVKKRNLMKLFKESL